MGVVREVGDVKQLTGKMGEALVKRDIQIVDDSLRSVIATLWGERAKNFDASSDVTILVFKRALVRTYHGILVWLFPICWKITSALLIFIYFVQSN